MRYADAAHIDTSDFAARRPAAGALAALAGELGLVASWWFGSERPAAQTVLLGCLLLCWLLAWWRECGALWRAPLSLAMLLVLLQLSSWGLPT